jgi:hypothetical protein
LARTPDTLPKSSIRERLKMLVRAGDRGVDAAAKIDRDAGTLPAGLGTPTAIAPDLAEPQSG